MSRILLLAAIILLLCMPLACNDDTSACVTTQETHEYDITATSAILHGWLDDLNGSPRVEVWFWVGTSASDPRSGDTPRQTMTAPGAFSYQLTNLDPETTYFFQAYARGDTADETGAGMTRSFTTLALVVPATVTTGDATAITSEGAMLHGAVQSMGMASSLTVSIEVGTTSGGPYTMIYSVPVTFQSPGPFSVDVSGLSPETTYYYRASGMDIAVGSGYGEEESFETTKGAELTISSSQMVTEGSTVKVTGQAQNTGTLPLTHAQIGVNFKDALGALLGSAIADKDNLGLGEIWTWEATYPSTDISNVVSYEAYVAYVLWT
jgi:hypothetical protein